MRPEKPRWRLSRRHRRKKWHGSRPEGSRLTPQPDDQPLQVAQLGQPSLMTGSPSVSKSPQSKHRKPLHRIQRSVRPSGLHSLPLPYRKPQSQRQRHAQQPRLNLFQTHHQKSQKSRPVSLARKIPLSQRAMHQKKSRRRGLRLIRTSSISASLKRTTRTISQSNCDKGYDFLPVTMTLK